MIWNNKKIKAAWERYVKGAESIPEQVEGVRTEILDSWRRSQGSADPFAQESTILSRQKLKEILAENTLLIRIAYPYLLDFYRLLYKSDYQILLTDANGVQLKCITGNQQLCEMSEEAQVTDGCIFSEETNGTNGVSLCLKEKRPMLVYGPEHYRYMFQNFVCYASPINAPSGNLIGCICIMGSVENYRPDMMNTLRIAVNGIEKELKLTQSNNILTTMLDMFNRGVLFIGSDHRIIQYNAAAKKILNIRDIALHSPLESVIRRESVPEAVWNLDREIDSMECTLLTEQNAPIHVNVSVKPPSGEMPGADASLLILDSQESAHGLTARIAGYRAQYTFDSIIGDSEEMQKLKTLGYIAADSASNVLLFGESGTGKELFAQSIHNGGSRRDGPFVAINCGSLPKDLIESELFGYESGSFSGSMAGGNPGKFELAAGGTLFLDEIGSMPLEAQAALLRVLQTHEVTRLGGKIARTVDVRIIAATNINLLHAVQNHTFRNDLYYRLNVLNVTLPPLRGHTADILPLAMHFLKVYGQKTKKQISGFHPESIRALLAYHWPGNIRELENIIERTVNITPHSVIQLSDLPDEIVHYYYTSRYERRFDDTHEAPLSVAAETGDTDEPLSPEIREYNLIIQALQKTHGYTKTTAALLDMPLSTLYRKMQKYNISPKDYRVWGSSKE